MRILVPRVRDQRAAVEHPHQTRILPSPLPFLHPRSLQAAHKVITVNTHLQEVSICVFWRDFLMIASTVMIPPPGVMVDGHYPPAVGLPTSSARLHQASWQPAPPWGGDGSQPPPPHMIHPGYAHPYYNAPPEYYRPMHSPPDAMAHQQIPNGISSSSNGESSSSRQGSPVLAVDPSLDHTGMEDHSETGDPETAMIDPSLVSPPASVDSESLFTRHRNICQCNVQCDRWRGFYRRSSAKNTRDIVIPRLRATYLST